jgi:hypothetical protein
MICHTVSILLYVSSWCHGRTIQSRAEHTYTSTKEKEQQQRTKKTSQHNSGGFFWKESLTLTLNSIRTILHNTEVVCTPLPLNQVRSRPKSGVSSHLWQCMAGCLGGRRSSVLGKPEDSCFCAEKRERSSRVWSEYSVNNVNNA